MGEMNLKIKDERMVEQITSLAKAHNRTPDMEAMAILADALKNVERFDRYREAVRISDMTPKGIKQTDSTVLIREDRDGGH